MILTQEQIEKLRASTENASSPSIENFLDTVADLQAKLAAATEMGPCGKHPKMFWVRDHFFEAMKPCNEPYDVYKCEICRKDMHSHRSALPSAWCMDAFCTLCDHERLALAAILEQAIKIIRSSGGINVSHAVAEEIAQWVSTLCTPADADALDRMVNEARLEALQRFPADCMCDDSEPCEKCAYIAELRRAAGKGDAE